MLQIQHSTATPPTNSTLEALPQYRPISPPTVQVRTSVQQNCSPLCMCICHRESRLRTPDWINSIIGKLFLGYSGVPLIGSQRCTEIACCGNGTSLLKIDYYFPLWFLQRMITFRRQNSLLEENQISVRTPRVIPLTNQIFNFCYSGDVDAVRSLFTRKLASPFDVSTYGYTPLMVSGISKYTSAEVKYLRE